MSVDKSVKSYSLLATFDDNLGKQLLEIHQKFSDKTKYKRKQHHAFSDKTKYKRKQHHALTTYQE